jgi:integrase
LGLRWQDLDGNNLSIERQLFKGGASPTFILPKRGGVRTVDLSDETVLWLQAHRRKQAEVKMANRAVYGDQGLIFAQAWEHMSSKHSVLGSPLNPYSVNTRLIALCTAAKVRSIRVHGLRHTCATLLLAAGVQPHVVQRRLGHKSITMTLGIYGHVLPSMQADAARLLATQLHG